MDNREERFRNYQEYLIEEEKKELQDNAHFIQSFKEECASKGVILTDGNFSYIEKTGIVATYPNLINYLLPDFIKDKDGLLNFTSLTNSFDRRFYAKGYLYSEKFVLMAHSYFRRGHHELNAFAPRFIEEFWKLNDNNLKTSIALDPNRVRVDVNDRAILELDTWFGAKFKRNVIDIPDGIVKLKMPPYLGNFDVEFWGDGTYSLDIKWSTEDTKAGLKRVFYAEEFKTTDTVVTIGGESFFPVKYIHSEFDVAKGCFVHFDGAIHLYTFDEYCERVDADINYNNEVV